MADNISVTPGSGATVAADDIGGVMYQRVKVSVGADGAAADAGHAANPFRIDPTGSTAQPVTDNGGSLTVDAPATTPVFVRLSDGTAALATLPVSLASVPSHPVTNAGTFAVQVNAAIPAGTNNIGDVDILTQPGAANLATAQVSVDTTSGGVTVAASRATRRAVTIVNHGTTAVYLGVGTVTTSNGFLLPGIVGAAVTFATTAAVKGIVASGSQTVGVAEEFD